MLAAVKDRKRDKTNKSEKKKVSPTIEDRRTIESKEDKKKDEKQFDKVAECN